MILSKNIPFNATTFIRRCTEDVLNHRCARPPNGYLTFLIEQTEKRYPKLMQYIRIPDRKTGEPRFSAQADHIVPREVWGILVLGVPDPERCGTSFNVLTDLFWRDSSWNMGSDGSSIRAILAESASIRPASPKGIAWRRKWIEIFLRTKRDEGLLFAGDLMHPRALDRIHAPESDSNWMNRG